MLEAFATGALGTGIITIEETNALILGANDALTSANSLVLNGDFGLRANNKVESDFNNTVGSLTIDGAAVGAGTYTNTADWFDGTGSLTVMPEPSSALLLGLAGVLFPLRHRV